MIRSDITCLLLVLVLLCVQESASEHGKVKCGPTICDSYDLDQSATKFWDLIPDDHLSPAAANYRSVLLDTFEQNVDETFRARFVLISIWSYGVLTNMKAVSGEPDISCVLKRLIAVDEALDDPYRSKTEYKAALDDYMGLSKSFLVHATYTTKIQAGCNAEKPQADSFQECKINRLDLGERLGDIEDYPKPLKKSIWNLLKSDKHLDHVLALIAISVTTETATKIIQGFLPADSLTKIMGIIACDVKIPPKCCKPLENKLKETIESLAPELQQVFDDVIDELNT